jgi:NAD-dependent dihydropyrimidine dehydrogenase PreA subunit
MLYSFLCRSANTYTRMDAVHLLILRELDNTLRREKCVAYSEAGTEMWAMCMHRTAKHIQTLRIKNIALYLDIKIGFDRLDVGTTDSIPALETACHGTLSCMAMCAHFILYCDFNRHHHSRLSRFVGFVAMRLKTVTLAINGHLQEQ